MLSNKLENKEDKKISFYNQLLAADIIDPILEAFMQGKIEADIKTGKLSIIRHIALNRTWVFSHVCPDRKCAKWLGIYYSFYKILPPPCKQCWKVVYAPQGLSELIEIQKLQSSMALPAKCGTETRDYTSGLGGYRAFWYCPFNKGLEGGRAHFERIKSALVKKFGEELILDRLDKGHFFLKRGCTEFERDFGPSDSWDNIDYSHRYTLLESVWEDPEEMTKEWTPLIYTNLKRWIEFAVAHGDPDALNYLDTPSLGVPSVKYHNSKHSDNDFKCSARPLNERTEDRGMDEEGIDKGIDKGTKEDLFRLESE